MSAGTHAAQEYFKAVGWTTQSGKTYMSASMLRAPKYFKAVGWIAQSGKTYMSAGTHAALEYFKAVGWIARSGKHICWPARMQHRNITWPLARTLAVDLHI